MSERDWDGFDRDDLIGELEDRIARIEDLEGSLEEWRADFNELSRLRSAPGETEALREALEDAEYALERIELMTRDCYALPAWWRKVPQRVNEIALVALRRLSRPSTHVGDEG